MERICPKSCKTCVANCRDLDPSVVCTDVVRRGYCQRSDSFGERCARSCGFCSTKKEYPNMNNSNRNSRQIIEHSSTRKKPTLSYSVIQNTPRIARPLTAVKNIRNNRFVMSVQPPQTVSAVITNGESLVQVQPVYLVE